MQIKVRHSVNGKIFWGLWLIPSFILTLQLFLLGIQNFTYQNYFIVFPILLLIFFMSYLVLLLFRRSEPILIEGDSLTIAETFSLQRKTFLISEISSVSVDVGIIGARVRLQDGNGMIYTIGGLHPEDVTALRKLSSFHVL